MLDFFDVVEPLLDQLQPDPNRPLPGIDDTTTLPRGGSSIEGSILEADFEGDRHAFDRASGPRTEDVEAAQSAYREVGIDVLAYYKSFRFRSRSPFPGHWGIFVFDVGIASVATEYRALNPALSMQETEGLAYQTLVAHERYHFWIDAWTFGQEILPIPSNWLKKYEYYISLKPQVELTKDDFEESLANHYAYKALKAVVMSDGSKAEPLIRGFFDTCPEPYSLFSYDAKTRAQREGLLAGALFNGLHPPAALMAFAIKNALGTIAAVSPTIRPAPAFHPVVHRKSCPVHQVKVHGYAAWARPFQGPTLKEFEKFVLNYLSGQKEKTTDHSYYKIDNGEKLKFPNPHDKEVRGYELKGSLTKAGMTHGDFVKARRATNYWESNCPRSPPMPPLGA